MKRCLLILILFGRFEYYTQTCQALYSFTSQNELITFNNWSTVSNAHYYWNFGDGTSSNLKTPAHAFAGSGNYLVTLYVLDTITKCHNLYEQWVKVIELHSDGCAPGVRDSFFISNNNRYLKLIDSSANCSSYSRIYASAGGFNQSGTFYFGEAYPINLISYICYTPQSGNQIGGYKTTPYNYDRSKNYGDCSANFEFSVVSEDTNGQTILFKAMNKNAKQYEWVVTGFGAPIISYTDTTSVHYTGGFSGFAYHPFVFLTTVGQSGCRDSLAQCIFLRKKNVTYVDVKEQEHNAFQLKIFPNPTEGKLKIEFDRKLQTLDKLSITNTLGQIAYVLNKPKNEEEIDLSFLSAGIYYLKVENKEGQRVFKVLKE